jgi:hypothetical protein
MTIYDRLTQLWSLLVESAHAQRVLTYDIIGQLIGVPEQAIGCFLRPIQDYCQFNDLPPLTVLILNEEAGPPALNETGDESEKRARVYFFDWFSQKSPTPEDLINVTGRGSNEVSNYSRWQALLNLKQNA